MNVSDIVVLTTLCVEFMMGCTCCFIVAACVVYMSRLSRRRRLDSFWVQ
jgi:hypothetical protein